MRDQVTGGRCYEKAGPEQESAQEPTRQEQEQHGVAHKQNEEEDRSEKAPNGPQWYDKAKQIINRKEEIPEERDQADKCHPGDQMRTIGLEIAFNPLHIRQIDSHVQHQRNVGEETEDCNKEEKHDSVGVFPDFPEEISVVDQVSRDTDPACLEWVWW